MPERYALCSLTCIFIQNCLLFSHIVYKFKKKANKTKCRMIYFVLCLIHYNWKDGYNFLKRKDKEARKILQRMVIPRFLFP